MTRIFSNVVANIDNELEGKFPADFDYIAMIRKVSEDAGVDVLTSNSFGEAKQISLQGIWVAMERVHSLLATALAVYGARVTTRDTPPLRRDTPTSPSSENKQLDCNISKQFDKYTSENTLHSELVIFSNSLVNSRNSENKSKKNSRPSILSKDDDKNNSQVSSLNYNECDSEKNESKKEVETINHSVNGSDEGESVKEEIQKLPETNVRRRGRPKKYPSKLPSQQIYSKFRSKFSHRKKYCKVRHAVNKESVKLHRGRGRPRKFQDGDQEKFPCSECDFIAKTRNNLGDHKHRVHQASPTICDICQKVFPNRRYMKRHRASHVEPQHCCDVCGKMYKIRKAMLEHKKTHEEGYSRPSFQCEICPKTFCSNYILSCHVKSEHLGQKKSFLCSVCGKSFTTKHSLQEHSNAHTGAKPHICEVCGKGFCYESALRDHKFVHVGSKQFICEVCSKAFTQRSGLKMHMRIHQQNKQFICSDCGREFTQKQALQRHERVHKGDKPFICKLCSRTFSDASIIRRHMILVHKIHKDAQTWREDIICKVKGALNYHVERISEFEDRSEQVSTETAAKSNDLPLNGGSFESSYTVYKTDACSDTATSVSNHTDEQFQDTADQTGHPGPEPSDRPTWYPQLKHRLDYSPNSKHSFSASTTSAFTNSPTVELCPSTSYTNAASRQSIQDVHLSKDQAMQEGRHDSPTTQNMSAKQAQYSERENIYLQGLHSNRLPSFASDTGQNSERPDSYHFESERNTESTHYLNTSVRPASYPSTISLPDQRHVYSPENLTRDRPSQLPLAYTNPGSAQAAFPNDASSPGERGGHYQPIDSPPAHPSESSNNSGNNFPTSAHQPWSMYAYYSHLASQFGMTLGDYPYVSNSGGSHQ